MLTTFEEQIEQQIKEINDALATLKQQELKLNDVIEDKINTIIEKKLRDYDISETVEVYKAQNTDFINSLRENTQSKYSNFFNEKKRILDNAKNRLLILTTT